MERDPGNICFGLSAELDATSLAVYLQLLGRKECAELLYERLSREEIEVLVDMITGLMQKHLSKQEYHRVFLLEDHYHGETD